MFGHIVECTNNEGRRVKQELWTLTNRKELKASLDSYFYAYVLLEKLKMDGAGKKKRRLFIQRLEKSLCQELQEQRRSDATLPSLVRARLLDDTKGPPKKHGHCYVCPRQTDKKAMAVCKACRKNVCPVHCEIFCMTCLFPN